MDKTFKVLAIIIITPLAITYRGWVFSIIWLWFAVRLYGLPPLPIPAALALGLTLGLMLYDHSIPRKEGPEWGIKLATSFILSTVLLLICFLLQLFL